MRTDCADVRADQKMIIDVTVNDQAMTLAIAPDEILLDALRAAGFTSVKRGCSEGTCGACTILMDGKAVASCTIYAAQAHERSITTVEGLGTPSDPHPLQKAFVKAGAVQCGFCIPGMLLSSKALLDEKPQPTDDEVKEALDGNLCRCTGYVKQLEAVHDAAREMAGEGAE